MPLIVGVGSSCWLEAMVVRLADLGVDWTRGQNSAGGSQRTQAGVPEAAPRGSERSSATTSAYRSTEAETRGGAHVLTSVPPQRLVRRCLGRRGRPVAATQDR